MTYAFTSAGVASDLSVICQQPLVLARTREVYIHRWMEPYDVGRHISRWGRCLAGSCEINWWVSYRWRGSLDVGWIAGVQRREEGEVGAG